MYNKVLNEGCIIKAMLQASSFSTFYMCLISLKLRIMNVEINELNWTTMYSNNMSNNGTFSLPSLNIHNSVIELIAEHI